MAKEKVTIRNTKDQIFEAYEAALQKVEQLEKQQLNPAKIAEQKENKTLVAKAEKTQSNFNVQIVELKEMIGTHLTTLEKNMQEKVDAYQDLEKAIAIKEQELKDIYNIEAKAASLAALINAYDDKKANLENRHEQYQSELHKEIEGLQQQIKDIKAEQSDLIQNFRTAFEQEKKRAKEEFNYEFAREQKIKRDELADEIDVARKDLAEEHKALDIRAINVSDREAKMDELEAKVAEIPTLITEAKEEAADKAKKDAEKSFVFEKRAIEAKYTNEVTMLQNKVEMLENALDAERTAHKATVEKLEAAYDKVQQMAMASVDGSKSTEAVNRLLSTIGEKSGK